jgi:hypothetical protein
MSWSVNIGSMGGTAIYVHVTLILLWIFGLSGGMDAALYSTARLVSAVFEKETGTQFAVVPYRGGAPAVQDLAAGQIDLFFGTPGQLPLMRAGSVKAYAVTGDTRLAVAPDIRWRKSSHSSSSDV